MKYLSTRGGCETDSLHAVLQGLAPNGGLYVDPRLGEEPFDWRLCLRLPPLGMAELLLQRLLPDFEDMGALVRRAYEGKFETEELTPLVPVGEDWCLELFRGPTSAFKDVALSMLPQLISAARRQTGAEGETLILTATSGDTGKAALEGFHDVPGTRLVVFYPYGGVSEVQRRQMVCQEGRNVAVCAVRGNFDDCQRGVKQAFAALPGLSSANSINIGRLAPQLVYYFIAYASLCRSGRIREGERVDFAVPSGNFGDILAGYMAKRLGLPVGRLICATNANRVLADFLATGVYDRRRPFYKTSSPSMDILVSSNLERLLYYVTGDPERIAGWMRSLEERGFYELDRESLEKLRTDFAGCCCGEAETAQTQRRVFEETGYLCDPHTAAGFFAAERLRGGAPMVALATASPYKFPAATLRALGEEPPEDEFEQMEQLRAISGVEIPRGLAELRDKKELHRDLIGPEELLDYVKRQAGGKET